MSTHAAQIEADYQQWRDRLRRLIWVRGLCWVTVVGVAASLLAGWFDFFTRPSDAWVRWSLAGLVWAAVLIAAMRALVKPLRTRLDAATTARMLESLDQRSPGTLSLAVQAASLGSTEPLVEGVSRQAAESLRIHPSRLAFREDACRGPLACVMLAMFLALGSVSLAGPESWTAIQRLAAPWRQIDWTQYDWLVLLDESSDPVPEVVVVDAHEPLRWLVMDERGSPPDELWLQIRRAGRIERRLVELSNVQLGDGTSTRGGLIEMTIEEPVSLRVVGGDDRHMRWVHVEAYYPPRITGLQITTAPPKYTGLEESQAQSLSGHVECLIGSDVQVIATFDRPLESAQLIREGAPPENLELSEGGTQATAAWTVISSDDDRYQFEVVDEALGRRSTTRLGEVHALDDEPPTIIVETPPVVMLVTERAAVPVGFSARDDFAVADVTAGYSLTMSADAQAYDLPVEIETLSEQWLKAVGVIEPTTTGAAVGDRISIWAEARDHYDLGPPHFTRSAIHTLSVVTDADKLSELNERLDALVTELRRVHLVASQSADVLSELRIQSETVGQLRPADMELARKLMFDAQSLAVDVYESEESLLSQARRLSQELHWNDLLAAELTQQIDFTVGRLSQLQQWAFPETQSNLAIVVDQGVDSTYQHEVQASINRAWHAQREIADSLATILHMLGEYRRFGSLKDALAELRQIQQEINEDTLRAAQSSLGHDWSELSAQQQADLGRLGERQSRVADALTELVAESQNQQPDMGPVPVSATADEVRRRLASSQLASSLREAADLIADNELGQALPIQQAILEELVSLENLLAGRSLHGDSTTVMLEETLESMLQTLESTQSLLAQMEHAGGDIDPQRQLAWRTLQLELIASLDGALRSQGSSPSSTWVRSGRRAASRMRQAYDAMNDEDWGMMRIEQREAIDDLTQSIESLRSLVADRAHERMLTELESLPELLLSLIERQSELLAEVRDFASSVPSTGQWNRELLRVARELADAQQALSEDVAAAGAAASDWPAIHFALNDAATTMKNAAELLQQRDPGSGTQDLQELALHRLEQVLESFSDAIAESTSDQQPSDAGEPPVMRGANPSLVQVRLLRELQAELRRGTSEIVDLVSDDHGLRTTLVEGQRSLAAIAERTLAPFLMNGPLETDSAAVERRAAAEAALTGIEEASTALDEGRFTAETVELQTRVVESLDRILESTPSSPSSLAHADGDSHSNDAPSTTNGDREGSQSSPGSGASESSDGGTVSDADLEVQRARRRELAVDVWGHLPPRAQQQLQADFSAEFLPEYDEWIRRYYEALAEER